MLQINKMITNNNNNKTNSTRLVYLLVNFNIAINNKFI